MKDYSNQKAEIATIKERNITISLSDEDCRRLLIKAGSVGFTVDELLRNFVGDLVDGTYSNGSDERMYANQWLERCGFSYFSESTLLSYLLNTFNYGIDAVKRLIDYYDEVNELKVSIAQAKEYSEDCKNNIQSLEDDLEGCWINYHSYVDEFLDEHPDADIKKEIDICRKWLNEYAQITQAG